MNYCILLSDEDQKSVFSELGYDGLCLRAVPGSEEYPFLFCDISRGDALSICAQYGEHACCYYEKRNALAVQRSTAAKMLIQALGFFTFEPWSCVCADSDGALISCIHVVEGMGLLVVIPRDAMREEQSTIYGGFAKNLATDMYDCIFASENSTVLAVERAREKAATKNRLRSARGEEPEYDVDDILIKRRRRMVLTKPGMWERISKKEEEDLRAYMDRHKSKMPTLD